MKDFVCEYKRTVQKSQGWKDKIHKLLIQIYYLFQMFNFENFYKNFMHN